MASASAWPVPSAPVKPPTAQTLVAELAPTPARKAPGLGLATGAHLVPFQCSSRRVRVTEPAAAPVTGRRPLTGKRGPIAHARPGRGLPAAVVAWMSVSPAVQALLAEMAATPNRPCRVAAAPPGFGLGTLAHLVPFQRRVR